MLSRSVLAHPAPSAPLAGTSRLHRRAAYTRCLRCAGAPRRPASGSGLSLPVRPDMPSSLTPGSSDIAYVQCRDADAAFAEIRAARHSQHSRNPFHAGPGFRGFTGSHLLRPVRLLAPPGRIGPSFPGPPGTFTSRLPTGRSPFPPLDMTTTDGVMGLAWMSCAVRWSSPDRMEVRGHGVHQPQASRDGGRLWSIMPVWTCP